MSGTPVRILLARHGETLFNVEGRWQGQSDSPLTERGLAQARELGRALSSEAITAVYSSDLGRALQTAAEVAAVHGLTVSPEVLLRELDTGGFTGKNWAEIDAEYPGQREIWSKAPATLRMPSGETLLEAQTRALAFIAEVMPRHFGETVVIISHGGIGQAILVHAMGGTVDDLWLNERVDNCQISRLDWTPADGLKLIELSDVRHLEEVGSLRKWRTTDAA
jgi:broad specificity phosphatase PhoE